MNPYSIYSLKQKWQNLKADLLLLKNYFSYDPRKKPTADHLEIIENNKIVIEHIKELIQFFGLSKGAEISFFIASLIHSGYLSFPFTFQYSKEIRDIRDFYSVSISQEIQIFRGKGCCRHIAAIEKAVLDQMKIKNSIATTIFTDKDWSIQEMWLFLQQFHKKATYKTNHAINYIEEENYSFFVDATNEESFNFFEGKNQFAYSCIFDSTPLPLFSYNYILYNDEFVDFRKVEPLTSSQKEEIFQQLEHTKEILHSAQNLDFFIEFYVQNRGYYHNINQAHQRIEDKEQKMKEFIKTIKRS